MKHVKYTPVAVLTILMFAAGCGGSVSIKQNLDKLSTGSAENRTYVVKSVSATTTDVPPEFLDLVREKLKAELSERGMLGNAGHATANGVEVTINNYRIRSEVTRQLVGFLLSGADTVATIVIVKTPSNDKTLGEAHVTYHNTTYVCKEDCMALQLSRKIVGFLSGTEN
jgi:hypothetical protein